MDNGSMEKTSITKTKVLAFVGILLVFIAASLFLYRDRLSEKKNSDPYEISVIIRGKNTESWTTIRQGIDQAAKDLNCDVSFVTLSSENNAEEQVALIQREIANGANAIVISPVNSTDLEEPVRKAMKLVPIVSLQSTVTGIQGLPCISCDNYKLGSALADKLLSDEEAKRKVTILRNSMDCSYIRQRYLGVNAVLSKEAGKIDTWEIPDDPQEAYDTARGMLQNSSSTAFVALDGATLDAVAKAERDLLKTGSKPVHIYGLGRTNTVVSLLENQVVSAIGVENEFNLGYLSIQSAVNQINKKAGAGTPQINFAIVDQTNMYNSDNQRLLFPFVR
ncbi:MAG: sugar ABC transporter substrate-binding protein [Ruminococcaceae bacterium]|nr:sugar ABC transporter substrate-binding protein [Oscillospiraceae bacterium]HHV31532.1 sugar ABC transporter substrate-binding protein [Clostridiales bacterium]